MFKKKGENLMNPRKAISNLISDYLRFKESAKKTTLEGDIYTIKNLISVLLRKKGFLGFIRFSPFFLNINSNFLINNRLLEI